MSDDNNEGFAEIGKRLDNLPPIPEDEHEPPSINDEPRSTNSERPATTPAPPEPTLRPSPNSHSRNVIIIVLSVLAFFVMIAVFSVEKKDPTPLSNSPSEVDNTQDSSPPNITYSREEKPPVGVNNVYTGDQIRYCLSEKTRINIINGMINSYSQYEVSKFNATVSDYNDRCSSFRYRSGLLESVKAEVDTNYSALSTEAQSRIAEWRTATIPSESTAPVNQTIKTPASLIPQNQSYSVPDTKKSKRSKKIKYVEPQDYQSTTSTRRSYESGSDRSDSGGQSYDYKSDRQYDDIPKQNVGQRVDLSSLTPQQQASIEYSCFQARVKGNDIYKECINSRLPRGNK